MHSTRPTRLATPVDPTRDHVLGASDADFTLVEYGSYASEFCHAAHEVVAKLRQRCGDRLRYVYRHLPITDRTVASKAAELAEYAGLTQDRFWDVHNALMQRSPHFDEADLERIAAELGLPPKRVPAVLMPVAHALIQARRDLQAAASDLSAAELWSRPGGAGSVGFHLLHIAGSVDRLFSYARGDELTPEQVAARQREKTAAPSLTAHELLGAMNAAVEDALQRLRTLPLAELLDRREVGRARRPSNVLGLLFHAAEHTQRHTGQVITTVKILRGQVLR